MNESILTTTWFLTLIHTLGFVLALGGVVSISSMVKINKGAKANRSWALIALGLLLIALSEGNRVLGISGLPSIDQLDEIMVALGSLFILIGILDYKRLIKGMLK